MHFKCSSLTGPAIPLIVQKQPSEERLYVHKDLLTYHSPAFCSKIEGPWVGVSTAEIDLSEEGRTVVLGLIEWFYTGRINRLDIWALGKKIRSTHVRSVGRAFQAVGYGPEVAHYRLRELLARAGKRDVIHEACKEGRHRLHSLCGDA